MTEIIQEELNAVVPVEEQVRVALDVPFLERVMEVAEKEFPEMLLNSMYVTVKYLALHMQAVYNFPDVTFEANSADSAEGVQEVEDAA
jgi:hypothetical protein